MKSIFLLLAALATCSVFCKSSIADNSAFNISLPSSESAGADDEEGGLNSKALNRIFCWSFDNIDIEEKNVVKID